MKITLITVGKIKEKYLKDAIAEYSKRLSKYCKLDIIEVPRIRQVRLWKREFAAKREKKS